MALERSMPEWWPLVRDELSGTQHAQPVYDDGRMTDSTVAAVDQGELRQRMVNVLSRLNEQERAVLLLRYGVLSGDPLSLSKIGQEMGGISRQRVLQIEQKALAKLRRGSRHFQRRRYS